MSSRDCSMSSEDYSNIVQLHREARYGVRGPVASWQRLSGCCPILFDCFSDIEQLSPLPIFSIHWCSLSSDPIRTVRVGRGILILIRNVVMHIPGEWTVSVNNKCISGIQLTSNTELWRLSGELSTIRYISWSELSWIRFRWWTVDLTRSWNCTACYDMRRQIWHQDRTVNRHLFSVRWSSGCFVDK